jgi:hypothetical protein
MASRPTGDEVKKGHVCPPSTATHPEDRWETAFVYSFICKFTKLKEEVDGLESVTECVFDHFIESTVDDRVMTPQLGGSIAVQRTSTDPRTNSSSVHT